ncbi:unnamed protein product [Rotaria sordida]|uniref:Uncharacterized protein n=1 Tax=Rotaria sordida TaxID=392033 RepID=A0A815MV80_9BILA|nr:unnamed protein product [Rotaria sordida]CAF1430446.1 unnamed protein product [Rotaria sordida]CAF4019103.1 unnamed protein product [Rotaria sordida]CAF4208300.1 unnamed protein product [Rotaria sordida]
MIVTQFPPSSSTTLSIDLPLPPISQTHSQSTSIHDPGLHRNLSSQHHSVSIRPTSSTLPLPIFSSAPQLPTEQYGSLHQASSIYLAPPPPSLWLAYSSIRCDDILQSFGNGGDCFMEPIFAFF